MKTPVCSRWNDLEVKDERILFVGLIRCGSMIILSVSPHRIHLHSSGYSD